MVPCLTDMVLHGVKVMDGVMMEMIGAKMSVIPKIDVNPIQRFVDPPWAFTLNYLNNLNTFIQFSFCFGLPCSQPCYNSTTYSQVMWWN